MFSYWSQHLQISVCLTSSPMTLWRQAVLLSLSVFLPSPLCRGYFQPSSFISELSRIIPVWPLRVWFQAQRWTTFQQRGKRSFEWSEHSDAPHLLMWCNCSSSERCNSIAVYSGWMAGRGRIKTCCSETVGWNGKPGVCYTGWKWVMKKLHENCLFSDGIYPRKWTETSVVPDPSQTQQSVAALRQ